mmetsp:Transcript_70307/g.189260  ORF Transcript_70307/g.189260 Transcript_70307/m.189260 type:complete len:213 (+) Transcript_70307:942-1580(+)
MSSRRARSVPRPSTRACSSTSTTTPSHPRPRCCYPRSCRCPRTNSRRLSASSGRMPSPAATPSTPSRLASAWVWTLLAFWRSGSRPRRPKWTAPSSSWAAASIVRRSTSLLSPRAARRFTSSTASSWRCATSTSLQGRRSTTTWWSGIRWSCRGRISVASFWAPQIRPRLQRNRSEARSTRSGRTSASRRSPTSGTTACTPAPRPLRRSPSA